MARPARTPPLTEHIGVCVDAQLRAFLERIAASKQQRLSETVRQLITRADEVQALVASGQDACI